MIGSWWHRQEYGCEFIETTDSVFNFDDIARAISKDVEPLVFDFLDREIIK
jgi:hypothetical protein